MNDHMNPARAHERDTEPTEPQRAFTRLRAFHVMTKLIGPARKLSCAYCLYPGKGDCYLGGRNFRMSSEELEFFIRQSIEAREIPEVTSGRRGGEPSLLGLDFFRRAIELQRKHLPLRMGLINAFQTKGTILYDD